jgi:uncharacterized protein YlxP (DUF503 family)
VLVGVGRIVLDFFNNEKVATKHRQLESLCGDLRKKFNISVMEIADFEDAERCVIGFAVVIPETWKTQTAQAFVEKICSTIDDTAFARVMVEDWDLLSHGD